MGGHANKSSSDGVGARAKKKKRLRNAVLDYG